MTRTTTWSRIGTDVSTATDLEQVMADAGLDYNVSIRPLKVDIGEAEFVSVSDKNVTVNDSTKEVLGIVGKNYKVCQNAEAFDFVNYISEDLSFERAGQTSTGMVYIIAKLPDMEILNDSFTPYVIFQNGHNGMYTVKTTICPLRIVCQNQFNYSFREYTNNTISMRHNSSLEYKMADAKEVMKKTAEYMQALNNDMNRMATTNIDEKNLHKLVEAMFPIKADATDLLKTRIEEQRKQFMAAYMADDNQNFRKTLLGLVNAEADYLTHRTPNRNASTFSERQFLTVTFDPKTMNKFIETAQSILVA